MISKIGTGEIAVFRGVGASGDEAPRNGSGDGDRVWTDQIADCVAVAVSGETESGRRDVCLAHLHSRQYTPPARGGDLDDEDREHPETVPTFKTFLREHPRERRVLAATSWDHVVPVPAYFRLRFGLELPRLVHLQRGGNRGVVTLDVAQFRMYGAPPDSTGPHNDVAQLPTVQEVVKAQEPTPTHGDPLLRRTWARFSNWVVGLWAGTEGDPTASLA